jgi:hypothetical protein
VSFGLDDGAAVVDFESCCGNSPASSDWLEIVSGHIETNGGSCSSASGNWLGTTAGSVGINGGGDAGMLEMFQTRLFTASRASW